MTNNLKTAINRIRKAKANWGNPGSFGDHLLEDIEHRLNVVRIRYIEEERRALRDAAEDVTYAILRETILSGDDSRVLIELRNELSTMSVAA